MVYQWVYSYSCWNRQKRPGDARTRGFGTFSWTKGLTLDDIDELERRCSGYNYPTDDNIPPRPTSEEIDRLLPVAFYSFTLASGKQAIVRTRYVGEGFYDKRWGAIISHGLVLPEGEEWPLYPMEYFDSPAFWNELPPDVREEAVKHKDRADSPQPPYLPALDFDSLKPQGKYTPEGVAARIRESDDFAGMLATLLNAYFNAKPGGEPLCINAPHDDIPWLFAGLSMAFPQELSSKLSFSTYLSDKVPMASEVGRWYDVAAVERRNSLFDLVESPRDDHCKWYVDALFGSRKELMVFLRDFTGLAAGEIPCAARLFRFLKGGGALDGDDMLRAQKLLMEHGDEDVRQEFIETLTGGRGLPEKISDSWFSNVFALVSDYEGLRPLCYDLFLRQRSRYQGDAFAFFAGMADKYPREITVLWLDEYAAEDLTTTGLLFSFFSLCRNGAANELATSKWDRLFCAEARDGADWNEIVAKAPKWFADGFVSILCRCPDDTVREKAFDRISQDLPQSKDFALKAMANGRSDAAKDILTRCLRRESRKPLEALERVSTSLEKADVKFARECFWDFFSCVNGNVETIGRDSLAWLLTRRKNNPPKDDASLLKDLNATVVFPEGSDPSYRSMLEGLLSEESAKGLRDGRIGLIAWFLRNLEAGAKAPDIEAFLKELASFGKAYRSLSPKDQSVLCGKLLPFAVEGADDKIEENAIRQHSELLMLLGATAEQSVRRQLVQRYVRLIGCGTGRNVKLPLDIRLVAGLKCALGALGDSELRKLVLGELADHVFRRFGDSDLDRLRRDIKVNGGGEKRNWEEFCEEIRKSKTLFARIKSVVGSVFFRRK